MTAEEKAVAPSSSLSRDQRTALSLCVCSITRSHPIARPRPPTPFLGRAAACWPARASFIITRGCRGLRGRLLRQRTFINNPPRSLCKHAQPSLSHSSNDSVSNGSRAGRSDRLLCLMRKLTRRISPSKERQLFVIALPPNFRPSPPTPPPPNRFSANFAFAFPPFPPTGRRQSDRHEFGSVSRRPCSFRHWKFCAHAMRSTGEGANEELPCLAMAADGAVN